VKALLSMMTLQKHIDEPQAELRGCLSYGFDL
jgi:hypothetical protein